MRKKLRGVATAFLLGLVFAFPGGVAALSWQVDDALSISVKDGTRVYSGFGGSTGGLFLITNNTKNKEVFETFCVELDETTAYAQLVEDVSDDKAMNGGRNTDSGDQLSGSTKWLVAQYYSGAAAYNDPRAVQLAIWYLEEEYFDNAGNPPDPTSWLDWYTNQVKQKPDNDPLKGPSLNAAPVAVGYINDALNHSNFQAPYILVLDTDDKKEGVGNVGQSYVYVPEPLTISLLGLGLLAVGIGAGRLRKKA